jgi:hypothetical protein
MLGGGGVNFWKTLLVLGFQGSKFFSSCLDLASICIVVRHFKFSFQILKHTWFVVRMPLLDGIKHYPKEEVSVVM